MRDPDFGPELDPKLVVADALAIGLSAAMANLIGDDLIRDMPGARLVVVDPEVPLPDVARQVEVLFLSSDLMEALKYRGFQSACVEMIAAPSLRWVQSGSSGHERPIFARMLERGLRLTTAAGVHSIPIAQYVLSHMLALVKRHRDHDGQQRAHEWCQLEQRELTGLTIGILGLGDIGREVARLARAFGMRVIASRRQALPDADVDAVTTPQALFAQSDFVVVAMPHTADTDGFVDAALLRFAKPGLVLINVARGAIVQEDALIAALDAGHLATAVLDVAATEPLPPGSPLWSHPDIIVTPHDSAWSPLTYPRLGALFRDNLRIFRDGGRMHNEVGG